jgi:hypothetical protein
VVCRVFKKCQIIKMRPPQGSPTMDDSPCHDGNASLGELGELDVSSILGSFTPAAAHASSTSSPGALHQGAGESFGHRVDINAYMSWMAAANQGAAAAAAAAMLPWATTPGLFGNVFAPNHQLVQKPLPFAGCSQPRDFGGVAANVGSEHAMFASSLAKVEMECDQQQQQPAPAPEQQLGMDESTWRAF